SDRLCGRQAMVALQRWGGTAVDVSEGAIVAAVRALAAKGLYVEPASAVSLAAYRAARGRGLVSELDTAVLLLTSTAMKWPEAMARIFPLAPLLTREDLERSLSAGPP
ncbi:MAG: pyridoxal-phosphate dependent enzyme, partial [Chloroflexi bacterium]|nr:pyridoxal-phosphate dependent enzyme [Chloroflexota bacterium]